MNKRLLGLCVFCLAALACGLPPPEGMFEDGGAELPVDAGAQTAPAADAGSTPDAGLAIGPLTIATSITPNPPKTGRNELRVTLSSTNAPPITGAKVTVGMPQMPSMGHGSSESPTVTEVGEGVYRAYPVTFTMPGAWTIKVTANDNGRSRIANLTFQVK